MEYLRTMKFMKRKEEAAHVRDLQEKTRAQLHAPTMPKTANSVGDTPKVSIKAEESETPSALQAPIVHSAGGITLRMDYTFPEALHSYGRKKFGGFGAKVSPVSEVKVEEEGGGGGGDQVEGKFMRRSSGKGLRPVKDSTMRTKQNAKRQRDELQTHV